MLDRDLAELYGVETRVLNQAVKRNMKRFPEDFMFQLSRIEFNNLKSQFVTSSWGGVRKLPLVFTEQGIAMLSGILNNDRAIKLMTQFYREYPGLFAIGQQPVAQLPDTIASRRSNSGQDDLKGQQPVADIHALVRVLSWTVNILLIQKVKDLEIRKWYMCACIEQGLGRDILAAMIKSNTHDRQGEAEPTGLETTTCTKVNRSFYHQKGRYAADFRGNFEGSAHP